MRRISEKDKWETKTLAEIATEVYSGNEVTKAQLGTGDYPAIKCGDINSGLPMHFTKCISFVDSSIIRSKKYFEQGDLLVGALAHKIEVLGKASIYLGNHKCIAGAHVIVVKHNENPKFLAYMFSSQECRSQIKKYAMGAAVCEIRLSAIRKIKIPLPPLEEQERRVAKLDKFRTITEDLEEGIPKLLTQTRQQYEYYKEKILSLLSEDGYSELSCS